jgi:hypothetical protein
MGINFEGIDTLEGIKTIAMELKHYDLVLVDTNIIGACSIDRKQDCLGLSETIYDINRLSQLERFTPYIAEASANTKAFLEHVVSQDHVFTVPGIRDELKAYQDHIQAKFDAQTYKYKKLQRNTKKFSPQPRRGYGNDEKSLLIRRRNQEREKLNNGKVDLSGLDSLASFADNLGRIIEEIKIYDGPSAELRRDAVEDASEADYKLVGAGIGFLASKEFKAKLQILTFDRHIGKLMRYALN